MERPQFKVGDRVSHKDLPGWLGTVDTADKLVGVRVKWDGGSSVWTSLDVLQHAWPTKPTKKRLTFDKQDGCFKLL